MIAFNKAGIASAALAVIAIGAQPAIAADLGSYGQGSTKDGYVPLPRIMASSGAGPCYMRADVGYAWSNASASWPVRSGSFTGDANTNGIVDQGEIAYTYQGSDVANADLENTWLGEVGLGCGSGSRGLRAEVMFGFRGDRDFSGEPHVYNPGPTVGSPAPGTGQPNIDDPMHTSLKTYTLMLNAYYDIGKFGRFVPYVGAGIGAAYHQLDDVSFTGNPALTNSIHGNNDLAFAWAVMAGVGIQLTDRAILDIGYRYLDAGSISSQRSDTAFYVNPAVKLEDLTSHEIKVGLRYHFGSGDCCDAMPLK